MANPIVVARRYVHKEKENGPDIGTTRHLYWCPGCDALHSVTIRPDRQQNGASWGFQGSLECPTYEPSQLTTWEHWQEGKPAKRVCHTFIRDGKIQFLNDCTHALKGQTVPLPPLPDWVLRDGDVINDVDA